LDFPIASYCGNMPRQAAVPMTSAKVFPTVALLSRVARPINTVPARHYAL